MYFQIRITEFLPGYYCLPLNLRSLFFPKSHIDLFLCAVGYAWLPLLKDAQLASQEHNVPVASSLPPSYLSLQEPASGKVLLHTFMLFKWHRAFICRCFTWEQICICTYLEVEMINRVSVLEYSCPYHGVCKLIHVLLDWEWYVADSQVYMEKMYFITVCSTILYLTSTKHEWA